MGIRQADIILMHRAAQIFMCRNISPILQCTKTCSVPSRFKDLKVNKTEKTQYFLCLVSDVTNVTILQEDNWSKVTQNYACQLHFEITI